MRCSALVRPFSDPEVGYVCGCLAYLTPDGSNQEGVYWRYENAVRALESRLGVGDRRQRRDLRGAPRGIPAPGPAHQPRPVVPLQPREARVARRVRAGRARRGAAGRHARERVPAQAAHDEPRLAGGAGRRAARPARLRAAVRAGDLLAPGAALRDAVPPRDRVRRERGAARPASVYIVTLAAQLALLAGALSGAHGCRRCAATTC